MGDCAVCDEPLRRQSPLKKLEESDDEHVENVFATRCGHMYHFSCLHDYINTFRRYSGQIKVDCPICDRADISQDFLLHVKIHDHDVVPHNIQEGSTGKLVLQKLEELKELERQAYQINAEIEDLEGVRKHLEREKIEMTKNLSEIQISDEFLDTGHEVITILEEEFKSLQTTCRYLEEKKAEVELEKLNSLHNTLHQNNGNELENVHERFSANKSKSKCRIVDLKRLPQSRENFIYQDEIEHNVEIYISEIEDSVGPVVYNDDCDYQLCEYIEEEGETEGSDNESNCSMKDISEQEGSETDNETDESQDEIECIDFQIDEETPGDAFYDTPPYNEGKILKIEDYGDYEPLKSQLSSGKSIRCTTSKYISMITPPGEFSDCASSSNDEHEGNDEGEFNQQKAIKNGSEATVNLHKVVEKLNQHGRICRTKMNSRKKRPSKSKALEVVKCGTGRTKNRSRRIVGESKLTSQGSRTGQYSSSSGNEISDSRSLVSNFQITHRAPSNDRPITSETSKTFFSRYRNFPISHGPYGPFSYEVCSYSCPPIQPGVYTNQHGALPLPVYQLPHSTPYPYVSQGYYGGIPPTILDKIPPIRAKNYLNAKGVNQ